MANASALERLLSRTVETDKGCMEYQGCIQANGYGRATVSRKADYAHRHVFRLAKGPLIEGLYVCHKCDNRKCINPDHLFLGTALENTRDALCKGRIARGSKLPHTKLTVEDKHQIAKKYQSGKRRDEIAKEFGISIPYVSEVSINFGVRRRGISQ